MVDQGERQAARSRLLEALRLYTGEAILFYVLTVSIAILLGEVPGWLLFLAIPMAVGWLGMGSSSEYRLSLPPTPNSPPKNRSSNSPRHQVPAPGSDPSRGRAGGPCRPGYFAAKRKSHSASAVPLAFGACWYK